MLVARKGIAAVIKTAAMQAFTNFILIMNIYLNYLITGILREQVRIIVNSSLGDRPQKVVPVVVNLHGF